MLLFPASFRQDSRRLGLVLRFLVRCRSVCGKSWFITESTKGGDMSGQCSLLLNTNPGVEQRENDPESQSESAAMGMERDDQLSSDKFSEEQVCFLHLFCGIY